jgi:hypothetical protein
MISECVLGCRFAERLAFYNSAEVLRDAAMNHGATDAFGNLSAYHHALQNR